jgi:HAD superfamily hydrolase (TIGR01509 family)
LASPLDGAEVVSWDVDGTLYELAAVKRRIALASLARPLAAWRELRRLSRFRVAMEAVRRRGGVLGDGGLPADREELAALEDRWYLPAIARAGLRPGVAALVDELARRGVPQVVVSDYRAEGKLAALGLAGAFARQYAGERVGHLKPSPGLFRAVCQDLGIAPSRLLHIGDRADSDGAGAEAAGCRVVLVGARGPLQLPSQRLAVARR